MFATVNLDFVIPFRSRCHFVKKLAICDGDRGSFMTFLIRLLEEGGVAAHQDTSICCLKSEFSASF